MTVRVRKEFILALILVGVSCWVHAESNDDDDGVTVETLEEDLDTYTSPEVDSKKVFLAEHFDDQASFKKKWVKSETKKQGVDEEIAKYDGKWELQGSMRPILKNDLGLVLTTAAKHAAISTLLDKPFQFKDKPLIVQYEVTLQEGQNCGGAYLKLLSKGTDSKADLKKFHDQTAYTIMFGPDKCGNDNKLHFIFRHKNPKTGVIEEKHSKKPEVRLEDIYKDKEPHLYTLIVRPDNTFSVLIDNKEVNSGSLLEDFTPAVNPPEEIDDPNDAKPTDWDEREKIVDPTATKPEDWDEDAPAQIVDPNAVKPDGWLDDEPETIPDPDAKKPADWDEDMDGEWEAPLVDNPACASAPGCGVWTAPLIPNPEYKGIWRAPLIPNPNYKGKWTPKKIPNPNYFRDDHPFKMTPIHAVGFELWSMSPMLLFDNLIITDDVAVAEEWAKNTFDLKRAKLFRDSRTLWGRMLRAMNYKPGYWALYIIYCLIPISIYVGYLIKRWLEKEVTQSLVDVLDGFDSVWDKLMKFAADNPWIYAFLILVVILIVGVVTFLCVAGTKESDQEEDPKKTDAVQEDDPREDYDDDKVDQASSGRRSKADLEDPNDEEDDDDDEKPDSTEETPLVDTEGAGGDGQRKRKSRRE